MTVYAIFGKAEASEKLIRASMSELLDTHLQFTAEQPFELVIFDDAGATSAVQDWSHDAGITFHAAWSAKEAVEQAWTIGKSAAKVLALIGDEEPTGEVAQALVLATKHGMEIRDLAEAGVTYVYIAGNPPTNEQEQQMPRVAEPEPEVQEEDVLSWAEIGQRADAGDKEMMTALAEAALQIGWEQDDVDNAGSWSEIAADIQQYEDAEDEAGTEEEPEGDVIGADIPEADEAPVSLTPDDFKGKSLKDVRELAVQAGIKDAAKLGKADLVKALCGEQPAVEEEQGIEAELQTMPAIERTVTLSQADCDAIAEAVLNGLIARLTR